MPEKKKLLVVGAGASGLPSLRHALLYDIDVICFEATNQIGGLWNYKPQETDCESWKTIIFLMDYSSVLCYENNGDQHF